MTWTRIAALDDIPAGSSREIVVGDRVVALFNVDGTLYALDGICPHQGGPLGNGELAEHVVTCPWHGWQFDVRSGRHVVNPSLQHPRFAVRVEAGDVWIRLDGEP